jgi:hypothetical protein
MTEDDWRRHFTEPRDETPLAPGSSATPPAAPTVTTGIHATMPAYLDPYWDLLWDERARLVQQETSTGAAATARGTSAAPLAATARAPVATASPPAAATRALGTGATPPAAAAMTLGTSATPLAATTMVTEKYMSGGSVNLATVLR